MQTRSRDDGFTLVELMVAMLLFGVLSAIAVGGLSSVQKRLEARGAHREVVTQLRTVQARAVAENTGYCVDFASAPATSWRVYRVPGADQGALAAGFACSSGTLVGTYKLPGKASFGSVAFSQRNGTTTTYALFYARGAASGGTFTVGGGGGNTYTITVDGLTGRVASTGK